MDHAHLTGFEVMETSDGNILQSGAKSRPTNNHLDVDNVQGWITRAVVLQTYYADEDQRFGKTAGAPSGGFPSKTQKAVLCDVRTYGRYSRVLPKVPVLQRIHGVWDQDIYIPRGARTNITGGDLVSDPSDNKQPTSAEQMDGDHVLVGFLENDPQQPVVLPFVMAHPNSGYTPEQAGGRVRRIRHNGTLVEWDGAGNLTLDATGSAAADIRTDGAETSNSGVGGQITLVTSDGSNQTSIHLNAAGQILLGSDTAVPADEPLVLGNLWISVMGDLINAIKAITVTTPSGPSTLPLLNAASFDAIKAAIDAKTHVSDFIFAKKAY
jgi:hypothetical protein